MSLPAARIREGLSVWSDNDGGAALAKLAKLVDDGALTPVVDRVFSLDEVRDAHRYIETGRARGKVVLRIGPA